jgi:hypothetical protein
MKQLTWLILIALAAAFGYALWRGKRHWDERKRAEDERLASFMAQALPTAQALTSAQALPGAQTPPAAQAASQAIDANALSQQKLLFESAAKAAQAGEAALSIQVYARLLSRYPDSSFAGYARTAIEEQKKKLARP